MEGQEDEGIARWTEHKSKVQNFVKVQFFLKKLQLDLHGREVDDGNIRYIMEAKGMLNISIMKMSFIPIYFASPVVASSCFLPFSFSRRSSSAYLARSMLSWNLISASALARKPITMLASPHATTKIFLPLLNRSCVMGSGLLFKIETTANRKGK